MATRNRSAEGRGQASGPPRAEPIGRAMATTAKIASRAFEQELSAAGGSQPTWLILLALKQQAWRTQQEIAATVGIEGATLTHHLDRMEKAGLIERVRVPEDKRAVRVELTAAGEQKFRQLAQAAMRFDKRLRQGLSDEEVDAFRATLERLRANVGAD